MASVGIGVLEIAPSGSQPRKLAQARSGTQARNSEIDSGEAMEAIAVSEDSDEGMEVACPSDEELAKADP